MKITIKCKLDPDKRQIKILDKTLSKCLEALNYISKIAWNKHCFNRVALHHLVYYKTKLKFKLHAQLCTSLRDRIAFSYKADKRKQHIFKNPFLPLNFPRTISFIGFETVSISTISGRQKIPLILSDYQKQLFSKAIKFCESELIKRNNKFFLNITIEIKDEPIKEMKDIIGVDLGIKNLATCSTGNNFTGKQVQSVRNRYQTLRSQLQSKGTRSAKRHLKKMSGREKRFQKDVNHVISKRIVELANQHNSAIALEDLKDIRKTKRYGKKQRTILHRWAFSQLRQFISYKAQRDGIPIIFVDPAYTSQTCSFCGNLGIRNAEHFSCSSCNFENDVDYNASLNIRRAAFNKPIVTSDMTVKGALKAQLRPSLVTIS